MFSAIRSRITYVNVVATLVLVFAMTGGALAAKKYLITSTKQISPSVLKSLQGKAGPAGAPGVAGAQGPAGPAGAQGAAGAKGDSGAAGKDGAQGKEGSTGPVGPAGATGATGPKGATGLAGVTGPKGATGQTGFTETLPKGKTETGSWSLPVGSPAFTPVAISFAIPLAVELDFEHVVYVPKGENPSTGGCAGGTPETPIAEEGFLCIYQAHGEIEGNELTAANSAKGPVGVSTSGAVLLPLGEAKLKAGEGLPFVGGTWAVTAP